MIFDLRQGLEEVRGQTAKQKGVIIRTPRICYVDIEPTVLLLYNIIALR